MTKISGILLGELSANSIQKSSRSFSGWSLLLPRIIAALTAPIEVPAAISILICFFTNALNAPHTTAPKEPRLALPGHFPYTLKLILRCSVLFHSKSRFLFPEWRPSCFVASLCMNISITFVQRSSNPLARY
jgi:hypothetical protein